MARTTYAQPASPEAESLIADLFALGHVGYVALGRGQEVLMRKHPNLETTTSPESNFYEELLVNPTLLKLASQRGDLDCGGLGYIAVGYDGFIEMIMRMKDGHISLGVSAKTAVAEFAQLMRDVLQHHNASYEEQAPSLFC